MDTLLLSRNGRVLWNSFAINVEQISIPFWIMNYLIIAKSVLGVFDFTGAKLTLILFDALVVELIFGILRMQVKRPKTLLFVESALGKVQFKK